MSFLRRLFGLSDAVVDPVLGSMVERDGQWTGRASWAHSPQPFALTVNRASEVPSQADRDLFQTLSRDYPALRTGLQDALFRLWPGARSTAETELPPDFGGPSTSGHASRFKAWDCSRTVMPSSSTASTTNPSSKERSSSPCEGRR